MSAEKKQDRMSPSQTFERMRSMVSSDNTTSYRDRIKYLTALRKAIIIRKPALISALNKDFDGRSAHETILAEIIPTIQNIDFAIKHLRKWMKPQKRKVAWHFLPAKNRILMHPKGLVLVISPWNYPISLSIGPLVTALAAGNRVILKPSEHSPHTSRVLLQLVRDVLPETRATVFTGGPEVSSELCSLAFDHILFTGSTAVGRLVMKSAAENLTPVTLELGGKSPAVIHKDYDLAAAAFRIARGKLLNAGQTCIAPDYVMVPRGKVEDFISVYKNSVKQLYPKFENNADYTSIINQHHFDRLNKLLDDAENKGATVLGMGQDIDGKPQRGSAQRKLYPHIVCNISDDMDLSHEEIFGPILLIVPYDELKQASSYINQRPRPLALYYFDNNSTRVKHFLETTISGNAAVNDCLLQFAQDDLPFGGIGPSGMGVCHGYEGFRELSHGKSVFYQSRLNGVALLDPPYGKIFKRITNFMIR